MGKKSEQLGMNFGTASYRLERIILFQLVRDGGKDICFRCGEQIGSWQDFSIEHKVAWLDQDPKMFWDLDNIAFSHKSCNSRAARRSLRCNDKRSIAPEGMAWCSGHRDYLFVEQFGKDSSNSNGLYNYCRDCRKSHGWTGTAAERERLGLPGSLSRTRKD